jgi:O-antigen ligase
MRTGGRIRVIRIAIAAAFIVLTVVVLQARTTYVQLVLLIALLLLFRRGTVVRMGAAIPVFLLVVGIIELLHIQLPGRLTSEISFDFFLDHVKAMVGVSDGKQDLAGAAHGVSQRLDWWSNIYRRLTADTFTTLTGLGYGIPLIDFGTVVGVQAREPHNSIISVTARLGVIGLVFWTWMQIVLAGAWYRTFKAAKLLDRPDLVDRLLFLATYFVLILGMAYGEDALEKPYFAIPYYLFWGIVLRMHLDLCQPRRRLGLRM